MPERARIGLDNPAFYGRLRQPERPAGRQMRAPIAARQQHRQLLRDPNFVTPSRQISTPPAAAMPSSLVAPPPTGSRQVAPVVTLPASQLAIVEPQPYARPAQHKQQGSRVLQRSQVQTPQSAFLKKRRLGNYSKPQITLVAMAGFLFLVGVMVSLLTLQTNTSAKAQVAALSAKASTAHDGTAADNAPPSEAKPPTTAAPYQVAPGNPKFITIDSLGVGAARIRPMGITNAGALQAPNTIYDAGWYDASAKPGDGAGNGAMLIDGHVHGPTLPGIFVNIKKLQAGDVVKITRGDEAVFQYKVVKVQDYDASTLDMAMLLRSVQPGQPGLNLVTCGGTYDRAAGEYTKRTVVFTVQI
ncbi:MAG: class sortase [Candidatus Saccharibacteria bacterium]|nr:class sortase [Candidatus Saccharibacteria bacterium]